MGYPGGEWILSAKSPLPSRTNKTRARNKKKKRERKNREQNINLLIAFRCFMLLFLSIFFYI
jgi:hypothetical protein